MNHTYKVGDILVAHWGTIDDVLKAHAQFGRVTKAIAKKVMGPNWPAEWDDIPEGEGIFEPPTTSANQ